MGDSAGSTETAVPGGRLTSAGRASSDTLRQVYGDFLEVFNSSWLARDPGAESSEASSSA